jgi:ABC-2 type transport system ATP-binding protein/sodium transport system ATP-binding protein
MIEVHQLTKHFPLAGGRELVAVDRVTFSVAAGEVYGLLGPNGAGKTTTLRIILGLLGPTRGHAAIAGFRSTEFPDEVKRRVGLVSASAGVYPWLTVRETLAYFADLYGISPRAARQHIERVAAQFGLRGFLDRKCATLSTGQRQRLNLARALIHDPPVVLLDEPTLGLDVLASHQVQDYIAHLRTEGKAVIVTTHHLDEAERYCDRFGLLHEGRLQSEGTLDELRAQSGCAGLVEMFLKLSGAGPAPAYSAAERSG